MIITDKDRWVADTHFFHFNVITYCNRQFTSVEEMNEALITNWNSVVGPNDRIFHLGDFCFGGVTKIEETIKRLNGYKVLVKGNHDRSKEKMKLLGFDEVVSSLEATYTDKSVYMSHVPNRYIKDKYDIVLCGHVHVAWTKSYNIHNVGVDIWDMTPQTLDFILQNADARQKSMPTQLSVDSAWEGRNDEIIQGWDKNKQK